MAVLIAVGGCGEPAGPSHEYSLTVSVSTLGSHPDPDGYIVGVDQEPTQVVGTAGQVTFSGLTRGDHWVRLWPTSIASNCRVEKDNPFVIRDMHSDGMAHFTVLCDWDAQLRVTVVTTGTNIPATFDLAVLSWAWKNTVPGPITFIHAVDANGTRLETWPAGETILTLLTAPLPSSPLNCTVSGENPRTVYPVYGQVIETVFKVACT